ncbi:hypothetical protein [Streptomyces albipurpureus]|uniref:Uncharacterized protein n=1 Tax=Streptomyces albipurpureus TaxID=2897419 RepID=A0ABT0UI61_9ACTN|nr:hypothetical protein [Streptomyces sp. CWNU-1]MCM2388317.1 hypothetical protein [Streptomyces sp. CWNU-1]
MLTATTESSRRTLTGAVSKRGQGTLVRRHDAVQKPEKPLRPIRPNSISDVRDAITLNQVATVRRVPGSDVAPPLAVLGHRPQRAGTLVGLARQLSKGAWGTCETNRHRRYGRGQSSVREKRATFSITPHPPEARPGPAAEEAMANRAHRDLTNRHFAVHPPGGRQEVCKGALSPAPSPAAYLQQPPLVLISTATVAVKWLVDQAYPSYRQTVVPVSTTLLPVAAAFTFQGAPAGSPLGATISARARSTDVAVVMTTAPQSPVPVDDVMYRASESALLRAVGWGEEATIRPVLLKGTLIGLLGTVAGTRRGEITAPWLTPGAGAGDLLVPGARIVRTGAVLSAAAGLVPVPMQWRKPTARLLAKERA